MHHCQVISRPENAARGHLALAQAGGQARLADHLRPGFRELLGGEVRTIKSRRTRCTRIRASYAPSAGRSRAASSARPATSTWADSFPTATSRRSWTSRCGIRNTSSTTTHRNRKDGDIKRFPPVIVLEESARVLQEGHFRRHALYQTTDRPTPPRSSFRALGR